MKSHTIKDVIMAGVNLEPLKCVHCEKVGEVTFNQHLQDALCGHCGEWQLEGK